MSASFSFDADRFMSDIEKVCGNLDRIGLLVIELLKQALDSIAKDILSAAQVRLEVQTRSGDLAGSGVVLEPVLSDGTIQIALGFTAKYAAQRDQGGTILPKKGTMLAIPLAPILTATGSRFDSPIEEDNLELVPILGNLFLADKTTGEFHWLLVPSVTQEGSHYLTGTVQERAPQVGALAAQLVKDDLNSGRSAA